MKAPATDESDSAPRIAMKKQQLSPAPENCAPENCAKENYAPAESTLWRWRYAIVLLLASLVLAGIMCPQDGTMASSAAAQFLSTNKNFKTYSDKDIGWLYSVDTHKNATGLFEQVWESVDGAATEDEALATLLQGLPHLGRFSLLLIPGLFTEWYPRYMTSALTQLTNAGLDVRFVPLHTDSGVHANAAFIKEFVERIMLNNPHARLICIGHSKGVLDVAAAITLYPSVAKHVAALVSMQAPYAGATVIHDLAQTSVQRQIAFALVEKLVGGSFNAVNDLTYTSRRAFLKEHPFPASAIPTISLATCLNTKLGKLDFTGLKPMIDYVHARYGGTCSDGCVSRRDAVIPGSAAVFLTDMDHFGPAFTGIPSTDKYSSPRLILTLLRVLHQIFENALTI